MLKKLLLIIGIGALLGLIGLVIARWLVEVISPRPANLGVTDSGHLADCPPTPNCVSSQADDAEHQIEPIRYQGSMAEARARLIQILTDRPRVTIVVQQPTYIHAVSRSPTMGFIDDNEFYFPEEEPVIHVRAAARLGTSDLGMNRKRIEEIRSAF